MQDVDYLTMAAAIDPVRTAEIVNAIIPKVVWEVGVTDPEDPTWVISDISWSTDPDVWEKARADLANIIEVPTVVYVNKADGSCSGKTPCYTSIQDGNQRSEYRVCHKDSPGNLHRVDYP